jgi:hypothetical protein
VTKSGDKFNVWRNHVKIGLKIVIFHDKLRRWTIGSKAI